MDYNFANDKQRYLIGLHVAGDANSKVNTGTIITDKIQEWILTQFEIENPIHDIVLRS